MKLDSNEDSSSINTWHKTRSAGFRGLTAVWSEHAVRSNSTQAGRGYPGIAGVWSVFGRQDSTSLRFPLLGPSRQETRMFLQGRGRTSSRWVEDWAPPQSRVAASWSGRGGFTGAVCLAHLFFQNYKI